MSIEMDKLKKPIKTSAVIFLVHRPTKSILFFDDKCGGITGYLFTDRDGDVAIKQKSLTNMSSVMNIHINEENPLCSEIIQIESEGIIEWRFVIIVKDFDASIIQCSNCKWLNKNQLILGRIINQGERKFIRDYILEQL